MRIAAIIVAHGSAPFLGPTLASIAAQSRPPDVRIAVCDGTTTEVDAQIRDHGFDIHRTTTTATDVTTRIAHNFAQGVRAAVNSDLAVLGDHDDVWHVERIGHHEVTLRTFPDAAMLASDGRLIDALGHPSQATLRETFPVPPSWNQLDLRAQWRYALRHSIATGGASAVVPAKVLRKAIPAGWLHDRWWSLLAVRDRGMVIDDTIVIDYRITGSQRVGLDTQGQDSQRDWWLSRMRNIGRTTRRSADIVRLLV